MWLESRHGHSIKDSRQHVSAYYYVSVGIAHTCTLAQKARISLENGTADPDGALNLVDEYGN